MFSLSNYLLTFIYSDIRIINKFIPYYLIHLTAMG